jgi:hypothetical protein
LCVQPLQGELGAFAHCVHRRGHFAGRQL